MVYGKIFRLCALEFCLGGIKDYTLDGDGLDFFLDAFFFKKLVEGGTAVVGRFAIFFRFHFIFPNHRTEHGTSDKRVARHFAA